MLGVVEATVESNEEKNPLSAHRLLGREHGLPVGIPGDACKRTGADRLPAASSAEKGRGSIRSAGSRGPAMPNVIDGSSSETSNTWGHGRQAI